MRQEESPAPGHNEGRRGRQPVGDRLSALRDLSDDPRSCGRSNFDPQQLMIAAIELSCCLSICRAPQNQLGGIAGWAAPVQPCLHKANLPASGESARLQVTLPGGARSAQCEQTRAAPEPIE